MPENKKLRILIIDDNIEIHNDFIKILSKKAREKNNLDALEKIIFDTEEYSEPPSLPELIIDTASQGQEGVTRVADAIKEGHPYALAFVDIRMPPGWDGVETIQRLWQIDPDVQVVICTAYSDYTWEETVEKLGLKENLLILKKPFDNISVRQLSCALTKKWQLLQETRSYTKLLEDHVEKRTHLLKESLAISRGTLESSADGIVVINSLDSIINFNQKFIDILQIPSPVIEIKNGAKIFDYIAEQTENPEEFLSFLKTVGQDSDAIFTNKLKFKNNRFFEYYSQPYKIEEKRAGRIWSFRDITERNLLEEKLEYQATHDALTGLLNRVLLFDRIAHNIIQSTRYQSIFGVFFFDIDGFKLINDKISHAAGDKLLQEITQRIKFFISEQDTFARLGGDEFVIVSGLLKNSEQLEMLANRILAIFEQPFVLFDTTASVTSSIGISTFPIDGNDAGDLLSKADKAMYVAKKLGGNQFKFHIGKMSQTE
jgi:diguanylate cyclase (GGDEF)-like protein